MLREIHLPIEIVIMSIKIESVMNFVSEFIDTCADKKFKKVWKNEKNAEMEKMLKKLVANAKKSVKPKKIKDPEAPKKKSAWMLFCDAERPKIKEEMNLKPKEVFAELARRWKLIESEAKEEFVEEAKVSKDEYAEKMKTYVPKEGTKVEKKKRAKKDKNAPKGARSAWVFFCEAERKKMAKEKKKRTGKEAMTELSARWAKVKGTKKANKFEDMAKEDKKRFDDEMVDYTPPESEDEAEDREEEEEEEEEKKKPAKVVKKKVEIVETEDEESDSESEDEDDSDDE